MPDSIDAMDLGGDLPAEEPGVGRPGEHIAWQLRWQARACAHMGSPLYGSLLARAAGDVEAGGPCWTVLAPHLAPARGDAVALRFMAAVHRLVLTGQAPELARYYPSAGGDAAAGAAWEAFRDTVESHAGGLVEGTARPCQTNEVGRAAGLVCAFLEVASLGLPLRLLEVGAAAGLVLRWDRFRYGGGGRTWGSADSPVDLRGFWETPPDRTDVEVAVASRRGCDPRPIDPTTEEGRLAVTASVWADQTDRLARLEGALTLARELPADVEAARAGDWLADVAHPQAGVATVIYHSVVTEYLPAAERARAEAEIVRAGSEATADAPVAWVRLEPDSMLRTHAVRSTVWPGGRERLVARCGSHGTAVRAEPPVGG
jgi:hypothetical protein